MIRVTEMDPGESAPSPFPFLGVHKGTDPKPFSVIVLFHDGGKGTVVFSDSPHTEHLFGTYREDWSTKLFEVYGGTLTLGNSNA